MKIALLGCGKDKRSYECEARKMYTGPIFKKRYNYCLGKYDQILILSAKYGILDLKQMIQPYELRVSSLSKIELEMWKQKVLIGLSLLPIDTEIVFHCSQDYYNPLITELKLKHKVKIFEPKVKPGYLMQFYKNLEQTTLL